MEEAKGSPGTAMNGAADADTLRSVVCEQVRRLDPDTQAAILRRLREQAECRLGEGRRQIEAAAPRPPAVGAKRMPPAARIALSMTLAVLFLLGFIGFWYGMIFGIPHHVASSARASSVWLVVRYAWCALLTAMLVRDVRRGELSKAWAVARRVTLPVVGLNALVIGVTVGVAVLLDRLFPCLNRSWLYLMPGGQGHAINIGLMPVQIKYFGIAFLLLLAISVPGLARGEEMKYRRGTVGWKDGAARSVRFGLAHCVAGVPLYAGLALTVGGLWFTLQYFRGGVERSTLHHATYNWILLTGLLVVSLLTFR